MPQSLASVTLHIIFSTKNRTPFLSDPALRGDLHAYLGGVTHTLGCVPLCVGGVADHIHLLVSLSRTCAIADFVKEIKRVSSTWVHDQSGAPATATFRWQAGYGVFSVSESQVPTVRAYIQNQEDHHRTRTFQEEYLEFLQRHGIEYDERYVWD